MKDDGNCINCGFSHSQGYGCQAIDHICEYCKEKGHLPAVCPQFKIQPLETVMKYILQDAQAETKYGFRLKDVIKFDGQGHIFKDWTMFGHFKDAKIAGKDIEQYFVMAKGRVVKKFPATFKEGANYIGIYQSRKNLTPKQQGQLSQGLIRKQGEIIIAKADFILDSILRQELSKNYRI